MDQPLTGIPIFAGLTGPALALLWGRTSQTTFPAGGVIVREGESGNRFYFIGSGAVRVCKSLGQSDEVTLATLGSLDFFGEMCILETLPRSATVQAVTETTLHSLSALAFYQLYQAMPDQYGILLLNIARDLSRRLRRLDAVFAARH